jgi:hypothetical protein
MSGWFNKSQPGITPPISPTEFLSMPVLSFSQFMQYQLKAIQVSGIPAIVWIDKNAARFRRRVERRFHIK